MLRQTKANAERVTAAAFDGAYGWKPNFEVAESLGVDLYVREKQGQNRMDPSWPKTARRLAQLERTKPAEYAEFQRFRSKAENAPSRIKARNPYIRLRRRNGDPTPKPPTIKKNARITDLPEEVQKALFDAATADVGTARLNESLAILIVANLRTLNTMEHLYNQRVTFDKKNPVTLNPPLEMSERDIYNDDAA